MLIIKSQEQFDESVLKSDKPVMIDFYADWCGPCKAMAPLMDELDNELDSCCVAKVNVDELPELAIQYRVVSIPTVLVFKDGECVSRNVGLANRKELEGLL